jgi:hypothetical protein
MHHAPRSPLRLVWYQLLIHGECRFAESIGGGGGVRGWGGAQAMGSGTPLLDVAN